MKKHLSHFLLALPIHLFLGITPLVHAGSASDVPKGATLLVDDPLDASTFKEHWKKAKGKFAMEDGIFTAREILKEKHHAGAGRIQSVTDGILDVEFRMVESNEIQFGFDFTTDEKKDHLLRAVIKDGTVFSRAGMGWAKQTRMKPFGPKPVKVEVPEGKWHHGRIEFHGQDVIIRINGRTVFAASARTPLKGVEKNRIALTARGVAQFRNVKLWSLDEIPDAEWKKRFQKAH